MRVGSVNLPLQMEGLIKNLPLTVESNLYYHRAKEPMEREILKKIISDQREYRPPKNFFDRSQSEVIQRFKDDPSIVILSGIRRSGKSTIMRLLQSEQAESDCYFNFDDERLIDFTVEDFQMLLEVFVELFGVQKNFYFDEIQNIIGWERFVRRLYEQDRKIFITGSNANLLSRELGTHLTGRNIQLEVYPLSFREIVLHERADLVNKQALSTVDSGTLAGLFNEYMTYGGIPEYVKFHKQEYLKNLYEGIIYRDIIARHKISNEKAVKQLVYTFASNVGKEFSYSKISETLGLGSATTVSSYCTYLEDCYLCFFLTRYSHSLSKQIQSNKKCYMIDPALIRLVGFRVGQDRGRLLENAVFLHLQMQGDEIYFHKEKRECDFIIRKGDQIVQAIQVCVDLSDEKVRKREVEGLLEAMQAYGLRKGTIVTEYTEEKIVLNDQQVHIIPAYKWLLLSEW